jgi:hypothetical protein
MGDVMPARQRPAGPGALKGLMGLTSAASARARGEVAGLRKRLGDWRGLMLWEKAAKKKSSSWRQRKGSLIRTML